MKKKNSYKPTDVEYHGGLDYGSNIHSISMQINQYVWNMIKVLDKHDFYGFNFEAKIGSKKVVVIMEHSDKEMLQKAKKLLKESHYDVDFLFITKVKKNKIDKRVWVILGISLLVGSIVLYLFYLYQDGTTPSSNHSIISNSIIEKSKKEPVIQDIEIDIDKLNAFKESFSKEDGKPVDDKVMKVLEITTSVISSMVSEEEKEKYSSKNLVESFNGKGGIRFVAKDGNLSKDFNATVKELSSYADEFIKDGNNKLALQAFDRALDINMTKFNRDDMVEVLAKQAELYEKLGDKNNSIATYQKLLKITEELSKDDFLKYALTQATVNSKLIELNSGLDMNFDSNRSIERARKLYEMVVEELKKSSKNKTIDKSHLALALNYLANFYETTKKEYLLSIEIRKDALDIYKKLSKKSLKRFGLDYYKTVNSLGHSYLRLRKFSLSEDIYNRGLNFSKKRLKDIKYTALSFRALAMVEIEREEFKLARKYYYKALDIYKKRFKKGSREFIEIDSCFAYLEKKRGDIDLAEKLYKKVILSYKSLNRKEPLVYNLDIIDSLNRLANLYLLNREKSHVEAEIKLFEAISLAKKVKEIESKEVNRLLVESYNSLAYLALLENNEQSAWNYYRKANDLK